MTKLKKMNTTQQLQFIDAMMNNIKFAQNKEKRQELITNFSKLKNSIPFSPRLNKWIAEWYELNKSIFIYSEIDDFDSSDIRSTFQRHLERFIKTGKIHIWTGASHNTIFGDPMINIFFRSFHDFVHITNQTGYDFASESIVASIQCSMLPIDFVLERELVLIEILGQNQYHKTHKEFLVNQRQFCIDYMRNPVDAIFKKQVF